MTFTNYAPDTRARPDWRHQAACAGGDPEAMFPAPTDSDGTHLARRTCAACPVLAACRTYALTHPTDAAFGVWGGLTEAERATIRRARVPRDPDHPQPPRTGGRPRAECGTAAAYDRHVKHHEAIDPACRDAHTRRTAEYRARTKAVAS